MSAEVIEAGNKLISKFDNVNTVYEYHRDWNLLMPVVEKIEGLHSIIDNKYVNVCINKGYIEIDGATQRIFYNVSVEGSKIIALWQAVIQFITWYNSQTNG